MAKRKREKAVALKYDREISPAPEIMAKGQDLIARRIVQLAKEANIPVVEDVALVSALMSLEVVDSIPENLYQAVAKVLAFLYKLDKDKLVRK